MEKNIQSNKVGFFKRIRFAIFKLEDYGMFLGENLKVAVKYFLILMLLVSVILALAFTYNFSGVLSKMKNYIENELPDFIYEDGYLNFNQEVNAYDEEYNFRLIINTSDNLEEKQISNYKKEIGAYGIVLLRNKVIFISDGIEAEEEYSKLMNGYDFAINNKTDLLNQFTGSVVINLTGVAFIYNFIALAFSNIITTLSDILILAVFGWIASRFCGINFKMSPIIILSIYSLTLSIVLSTIYTVVYMFTEFYIEYFNIIYLLIAYVYMVAAIFMIKYDIMKQTEELQKIIEVQKEVHEEEYEETEEKNKKEDKKEEKNDTKENEGEEEPTVETNREPDGSEI